MPHVYTVEQLMNCDLEPLQDIAKNIDVPLFRRRGVTKEQLVHHIRVRQAEIGEQMGVTLQEYAAQKQAAARQLGKERQRRFRENAKRRAQANS